MTSLYAPAYINLVNKVHCILHRDDYKQLTDPGFSMQYAASKMRYDRNMPEFFFERRLIAKIATRRSIEAVQKLDNHFLRLVSDTS